MLKCILTVNNAAEVFGKLETDIKTAAEDAMELAADTVETLARDNAEQKIGGPFGRRIADSVRRDMNEGGAVIKTEDNPEGYIADHVHFGGVIRRRNGGLLAIPLRWNDQPGIFARNRKEKLLPLFSKKRRKTFLFLRPKKGERLTPPLFVLLRETRPQKPRPWWPTDAEAEGAIQEIFENFI